MLYFLYVMCFLVYDVFVNDSSISVTQCISLHVSILCFNDSMNGLCFSDSISSDSMNGLCFSIMFQSLNVSVLCFSDSMNVALHLVCKYAHQ